MLKALKTGSGTRARDSDSNLLKFSICILFRIPPVLCKGPVRCYPKEFKNFVTPKVISHGSTESICFVFLKWNPSTNQIPIWRHGIFFWIPPAFKIAELVIISYGEGSLLNSTPRSSREWPPFVCNWWTTSSIKSDDLRSLRSEARDLRVKQPRCTRFLLQCNLTHCWMWRKCEYISYG